MMKTFRYRLYPGREENKKMHDTCFLCSLVYNRFLEERNTAWEERQESLSTYSQINTLPAKKTKDPRLKEVYSQVLQDVGRRVDKAFQAFFRQVKQGATPGYPRFRSARRYDSFTYPQSGFRIEKDGRGGRLYLSKIGRVKILMHRPVEGKIKTLTIRRKAGKWYACFSCEVEPKPLPKTGKSVGVDLGLTNLAITSDGQFFPPSRHLRELEGKLGWLQRAVSRKKKGSKRRQKAVRNLQTLHVKIANKRKDLAWKVVHELLHKYDAVAIERLRPRNMVKNHHLAKSISDASWGTFRSILCAKAEEWERTVAKVDPKDTTQECSGCGHIVKKSLSQRQHDCPNCGLSIHRDVNAAINILKRSGLGGAFGDSSAVAD